jgi:hypothetical protein
VRDGETEKFLIRKSIHQIIESPVSHEVNLDEKAALRELARMYAGYRKRPAKGTRKDSQR